MAQKKKIKKVVSRLFASFFIATLGLYALILSAKFFGSEYTISDGDYFITWSLLSILVLLAINHVYKK